MPRLPEPWKVKVVEPIVLPDRRARERHLRESGNNLFAIPSEAVFIDLLTDSGTSAQSQDQWAGLVTGDESYAGARSFYRFEKVVREIFGMPHVLPVHQGRAGERLVCGELLSPGALVPGNHHFDTTRANIEMQGACALDVAIEAARQPSVEHPFKGNADPERLDKVLADAPPGTVPMVVMTVTNNSVGGQPVSLRNLREVAGMCRRHRVPLWIDASRFAENAWFIREREPGHAGRDLQDIVHDLFAEADGVIMSAKKDGLANMGGFVAVRDEDLARRLRERMVVTEGFPTYGGLAGRDLEALAVGLREVLDDRYLEARIRQVRELGDALHREGVPVVRPIGGHAVYIDAAEMLPHIPRESFPGQTLAVELYRRGGIRAVEIGTVMFGGVDPDTGEVTPAPLDLVRLAIPRRVYSDAHLQYVASTVLEIRDARNGLQGLRMTHVPRVLRHFTARFAEVEAEVEPELPALPRVAVG